MKPFISFLILSINAANVLCQQVISIADFGLLPDTRENATPFVRKALESAAGKNVTLFFPKGRYDFWPQQSFERVYFESNTTDINPKRLAILIDKKQKFTMDGGGSFFIMHDRIQPITIDSCDEVTVKNFTVDWDIPLTAECRVVQIHKDGFEVKLDPLQFPYVLEKDKLVFVGEGWKSELSAMMEFDAATKYIVPKTGDKGVLGKEWNKYVVQEIEIGRLKFSKEGGFERLPAEGNYLVLRHSERDHAGMFSFHSKNILIQDVTYHHTAGLGILAQYTENIHFNRVKMVPNPTRILSGHDDGFHLMGCKGDVLIENCAFAGLMDDPINVHGTCARIVQIISPTKIRCKLMHPQSQGLLWGRSGDRVGFIENNSMRTVGVLNVVAYKYISKEIFEVEIDRAFPENIETGDALENLTWNPNLIVRNNHFGSCRARGLLISTPGKVLVENNIFESSGSAILIAGDANYWYESGGVKDITIRNNDFRYPCMSSEYQFCEGIISIFPEIPEVDFKYPFHKNIIIERNHFNPFDYPVLFAKSVQHIKFAKNTITRSKKIESFHPQKAGLTFISCQDIIIENNKMIGDVLGKTIDLINTPIQQLKLSDGNFSVIKKNVAPE